LRIFVQSINGYSMLHETAIVKRSLWQLRWNTDALLLCYFTAVKSILPFSELVTRLRNNRRHVQSINVVWSLSPAELLLNDKSHTGLKYHFRSFLFFIIVGLTEKFFLILPCIYCTTYCCKLIRPDSIPVTLN